VDRNDTWVDEQDGDLLDELRRLPKTNRLARFDIEDDLLTAFDRSPEALALPAPPIDLDFDADAPFVLTHYASEWFDETIASLRPEHLEEMLHERIPRRVALDPADARKFIEQAVAFVRYLDRAHVFPQANELLRVLGGDAAARLEGRIRDLLHLRDPRLPRSYVG
jgi:hypothetical protein